MASSCIRLRKRRDFLNAARGHKFVRPTLIVQMIKQLDQPKGAELPFLEIEMPETGAPVNNVLKPARIGFTVSKKVGNAVIRNRVRRRLKEAVNQFAKPLMQSQHDYVVIGRRQALQSSFEEIGQDLVKAFQLVHKTARKRERKYAKHPKGQVP